MRERLSRHLPDRKQADSSTSSSKGMSLVSGLEHVVHRRLSLSGHQHDIREAKRFLRDTVRTDWDYPPLPRFQIPVADSGHDVHETNNNNDDEQDDDDDHVDTESESTHPPGGFRYFDQSNVDRHTLLHRSPDQLDFEPSAWREREYSDEEFADVELPSVAASREFKFDSPDDIGANATDPALARKRKRQTLLDEECTWNDGLAHWLARRDVFCGAHTAAQVQALERRKGSASISLSATSLHSRSASSSNSSEVEAPVDPTSTPSSTPEATSEPLSSSQPKIIPTEPDGPPSDILVPIAPPMLANHPVRRRITPDSYSEIYTKIILQSRTPSVPINLLTLTKAIVQGWKDDGEWPPKSVEPTFVGTAPPRNSATLKKGVKAVGRALKITLGDGLGDH